MNLWTVFLYINNSEIQALLWLFFLLFCSRIQWQISLTDRHDNPYFWNVDCIWIRKNTTNARQATSLVFSDKGGKVFIRYQQHFKCCKIRWHFFFPPQMCSFSKWVVQGGVSQWQGSRTENDHAYENFVVPNHKDKQSWPVLTVETVFQESKIVNDYVKAP